MPRLKNRRHEKFCQLFVFGHPDHNPKVDPKSPEYVPDTLHNITQSYRAAGFASRGAGAASNGSRLIRRDDVALRLSELEDEAVKMAEAEAFRWFRHLPLAHQMIRRGLSGEELPSSTVQFVKLVTERAEGPLQYRFRDPTTGESKEGIPVFVYGGQDGRDDPPPPEDEE